VQFHSRLSEATVYMRYMQHLKLDLRIAHERLARICFLDYDREMALVAEHEQNGAPEIVGVARLSRAHGENEAEIAVLIRDDFQGQGLGAELLARLLHVARQEKLRRVFATMLSSNMAMQRIAAHAGFQLDPRPGEDLIDASINL
jgi:acetyltransferase